MAAFEQRAEAGRDAYAAGRDLYVGAAVPGPARSVYREQVELIFPWELVGRADELAELAAFCRAAGGPAYAWWQGPAWAGKTALMATLVLHPPPGVRVVSFFITARYAGQSDRNAFLDVVLEQLAEAAGQPVPAAPDEARRQAWFGRLLKDAAAASPEPLVLVVDGLDEDRGVTVGPSAHSIAALLPAVPPPNVRIVVAGRPSPPVPTDVPDRHPLRDPAVVRRLAPSPEARAIRGNAERELEHLLFGPDTDRDLLGLVATSGGGLRAADLADLTGASARRVERHLSAASGRTFTLSPGRWIRADRFYLLGHEELQAAALDELSTAEQDAFRARVHAWADRVRDAGWPPETSEYLLRGYFRLLRQLGDLPRMVAFATDPARTARMLEASGGDAAALAELAACQEAVLALPEPDVDLMLRIAVVRDELIARNRGIPAGLPLVWAEIGEAERAWAMASALSHPFRRLYALLEIARITARKDAAVARRLVGRAASTVRASPYASSIVLADLAEIAAAAGDRPLARRLADEVERELAEGNTDGPSWSSAARAIAATGDQDRIERALSAAVASTRPVAQAAWDALVAARARVDRDGLAALAREHHRIAIALLRDAASSGDLAGTDEAARLLEGFSEGGAEVRKEIGQALLSAARHPLVFQDHAEAAAFLRPTPLTGALWRTRIAMLRGEPGTAEALARNLDDPPIRDEAFSLLVQMLAERGDLTAAEWLAEEIVEPEPLERALAALIVAGAGNDPPEAADRAAALVYSEPRHFAYVGLAKAAAARGGQDEALALLVSSRAPVNLVRAARDMARGGHPDMGARLASLIEKHARSSVDPRWKARLLARLAGAVAATGDTAFTGALADAAITFCPKGAATGETGLPSEPETDGREPLPSSGDRASAPFQLAESVRNERASLLAELAEFDRAAGISMASADDGTSQDDAITVLPGLVADAGRFGEAQSMLSALGFPHRYERAMAGVVRALATVGEHGSARKAAERIPDPSCRAAAFMEAAAGTGMSEDARHYAFRAEVAVREVDDAVQATRLLASFARTAAGMGDVALAASFLDFAGARRRLSPRVLERTAGTLVGALAAAGSMAEAEEVASSLPIPVPTKALAELALALHYMRAHDREAARRALARAEEAIEAMLSHEERAEFLIRAVHVRTLVDGPEAAASTAARITDPELHARALALLADASEPDEARRLLVQALAEAPFTTCLPSVARIAPDTVRDIARRMVQP
ncbi:hypothetical protein [Actinomadura parmotrematis]|uniref:Nephrocystin 3-like N-terminal domain-containing protein n=1 Tax=Actinomadura parmotrematis TaxID=2864039 RepID=A0ABS7FR65_9ACTN|nr:hypothetical protein [Actinomadura parmotrematis]MBW8482900.1 hypothetical protein [Actinomadura parmotrematis]